MVRNLINPKNTVPIALDAPEALGKKVVEELLELIDVAGNLEEASIQPKPAYWFYRVPFAGVRYYSYE